MSILTHRLGSPALAFLDRERTIAGPAYNRWLVPPELEALAELRPWLSGQTVQQALPQRAEGILTGNGLAGVRGTALAPLRH
jgi:hypothetical protein